VLVLLGAATKPYCIVPPLSAFPHKNASTALLRLALFRGPWNVDEPRANGVRASLGSSLLNHLNLHVRVLSVGCKSVGLRQKRAVLPQVVERDVHQPGPQRPLFLCAFLAFHSRAPFVPTLVKCFEVEAPVNCYAIASAA
jgi:hypothetical protein